MSDYRIAIDQITWSIDKRAKYLRNLIVVVVSVGLISIVWAVVALEWIALAGLALLVPVCGFYFFLDSKVLYKWRSKLCEGWAKGEIDFEVLRQTIAGLTGLPKNTLQSMLATLPSTDDILIEQSVYTNTREAIASVLKSIDACRSGLIAIKTAAYTLAASALMAAFVLWKWQPLLGLIVIALVPFCRKLFCHIQLRRARNRMLAAKQQADFDPKKYEELVEPLDWSPVSVRQKNEFLAKVSESL